MKILPAIFLLIFAFTVCGGIAEGQTLASAPPGFDSRLVAETTPLPAVAPAINPSPDGIGLASPAPEPATPVANGPAPRPMTGSFFNRFYTAYANDWTMPATADSGPPLKFRGYPAPESDPPFPFTVWPYGGSVVIGQPFTQSGPLMEALWSGPNGDWWKKQ